MKSGVTLQKQKTFKDITEISQQDSSVIIDSKLKVAKDYVHLTSTGSYILKKVELKVNFIMMPRFWPSCNLWRWKVKPKHKFQK